MKRQFDKDTHLGQELRTWWEDLKKNNGVRAELRRAKSVEDILLLPSFHYTCLRFKPFFEEKNWQYRLAMIIGLLSHIQELDSELIAVKMAGKPKPVVSELRFRRLIQRDRKELYHSMIRIIQMLGKKGNIYDLSNSIFYWGDSVKQDWAYSYFPNTPDISST